MRGRKWTVEQKLRIVLEGIKGRKTVAVICREYDISQPQYYRWRDRFLSGGKKGLSRASGLKETELLKKEIDKLQRLVGQQTLEIDTLKKTDGI